MDQEKNLNEEVTETVEQVAETVEEIVETVEEIAEEVRPEVIDDFSEDFAQVSEVVEKKAKEKNPLVLCTLISSAISVVVTLCVLLLINLVPTWIYSTQIQGVWEFNGLYTIVDGSDFTLALTDGQSADLEYVEFDFEVTEKGEIKVSDKDETSGGMMAQSYFGSNKLEIEVGDDTITFLNMTWNKVDKETAKGVKAGLAESRKNAGAAQETVDITQDVQ